MATDSEDELAGTEQPFVAHLIELRDRLIKAMAATAPCTTCWPRPWWRTCRTARR